MSASLQPHASRPGASHASGHRFNKACDSCHISKVRCMPDPQSPTGTCKRCSKNGTPCLFSPVGPRRRPVRTKTDRIAELERRVKHMQIKLEEQVEKRSGTMVQPEASEPASALRSASGAISRPASSMASPAVVSTTAAAASNLIVAGLETLPVAPTVPMAASKPGPLTDKSGDVIDQGLLTESQADQLLHEFRSVLNGKCLGICLPNATSYSQLRQDRPAFWLSILCAASAGSSQLTPLAPVLFSQLKKILDARITPGGGPDLDALQALTNWAIFHNDPVFPLGDHAVERYSLAIQMAVDMAEASKLHSLPDDAPLSDTDISSNDVQLSRELLHWYWGSFSLAIKRRRPTMLRRTKLVEASLRILKTAQDPDDAHLIQWIKLVQIAAEAVLALYWGHTQQAGGLSGEARDTILESFEKRRRQWLVDCPFHLVNEALMLEYHSFVILVSEVIYPAGVADFSQRSHGLPSLSSTRSGEEEDTVPDRNFFASYKLRYTRKSITAAHACLDLATIPAKSDEINPVLTPSTDLLRRCGCFLHGRIFYALRLLLSVAHEVWRTKRYDIVDVDALKIDAYIVALRDRLEAVSDKGRYRVPSLWLNALQAKIEPWWQTLRRLLAHDRPAWQEAHGPSAAVRPPPQQECVSSELQQPAASPYSTLLGAPSSPLLPDFFFDSAVLDPLSSGVLSFSGLFDPPDTTDSGALAAMDRLPAIGTDNGWTWSPRTHAVHPAATEGLPAANRSCDDNDAGVEELDPFAFSWETLSEVLPGA